MAPSPEIQPPGALVELQEHLPRSGTACDLAGGRGDGALHLVTRGLEATLVEVSDTAIELALERSAQFGLPLLTQQVDLTSESPEGRWDVVTCFHYLNRPLLGGLEALLRPGGSAVVGIATTTNLERHDRPSARFLLEPGELPTLVGDLEIVAHREDWTPWGIHEARLLARKRTT